MWVVRVGNQHKRRRRMPGQNNWTWKVTWEYDEEEEFHRVTGITMVWGDGIYTITPKIDVYYESEKYTRMIVDPSAMSTAPFFRCQKRLISSSIGEQIS
jgi:hypothetical protein